MENLKDKPIKIQHSHSIKHLITWNYRKSLSNFKNLEFLELYSDQDLLISDLDKFENLKKLKLNFYVEKCDEFKEYFKFRKDFCIILGGVLIKEIDKFIEFKESGVLEFQLNNYRQLEDNLNFIKEFDSVDLKFLLIDNLPFDPFRKYSSLYNLKISDVKDSNQLNQLISFMKGCPHLCELHLDFLSLNQDFYDKLPSVSYLYINESQDVIDINFEFILKMPYLVAFQTEQDVSMFRYLNI